MRKFSRCPHTGQLSFIEIKSTMPHNKNTKLWKAFYRFHNRNPHIYELLKSSIFEAMNSGFVKPDSIARHIEYVRKVLKIDICSNHRAYYARIFVEDFPEHHDYFLFLPIKGT